MMKSTPLGNGNGSIMYGMVCGKMYLAYTINLVSCFVENPGRVQWKTLKWVLSYLSGSLNGGFKYTS